MDKSISRGQLSGVAAPPCSKSYAQRALAAALLAEGESVLRNLDFCDDTLSAISTIKALGAEVERLDERTVKVRGLWFMRLLNRDFANNCVLELLTRNRFMV